MTAQPDAPRGAELRVGLIGAGKMGVNHLKAMRGLPQVRVVGVADPRADPAELEGLLPADAPIVRTPAELFQQARPDVVHIVTPPRSHQALGEEALSAGSHVYIEKPFTPDAAGARVLLDLAAERGLQVCAGHQCLYDGAAVRARESLGKIGSIVHIESYFSFKQVRRSMRPIDQAMDILPHAMYVLLDFLRLARPTFETEEVSLDAVHVDAEGGIYGLLSAGGCRGVLIVTLTGRPVEQYVHIVGTNGSIRADLVSGAVVELPGPGASAVAALLAPYRQGLQLSTRATRGFYHRIKERKYGYPGLRPLFAVFYDHVRGRGAAPMTPRAILDTVDLCERIGTALEAEEAIAERTASRRLAVADASLPAASDDGIVLVTGAGGFLGRETVAELRAAGRRVRAITRQPLRAAQRVPGVEYVAGDLAEDLPPLVFEGVSAVAHLAAETQGGKAAHERNSVGATRHVLEGAARAGVTTFIHISSLAVLRPGRSARTPLSESTPVDFDTHARGPYVWGKAESERIVQTRSADLGLQARIVRLGPLVSFAAFSPPGRLGRELGPLYVAVGPKRGRMSLCDVTTAARVIRSYVNDPAAAPPVVNLVDPDAPARAGLVDLLRKNRPDLRIWWMPMWILKVLTPPLKLAQRILLRTSEPLDVASAFTNQAYDTTLARTVITRAGTAAPRPEQVSLSV